MLLGARARDTVYLINNEELPFPFAFDKASFEAGDDRMALTGQRPVVEIEPISGTLQPGQRLPVQVSASSFLISQVSAAFYFTWWAKKIGRFRAQN